ncbi:MAG: inner membrane protein, partial [Verrucomicrobiota bacterium]
MPDAYRYVERSIKYGVLFLVLVFTTFFLFEVTARQKIHPFQYLMVGATLCIFYLLLLSISEFIGFGYAYLIAAAASTILITWYCRFFLGGGVRTLMIGAGLAGVYTFLYITFTATGLRASDGRNRTLHRARSRDVRDAQSRLVRARRGLNLRLERLD